MKLDTIHEDFRGKIASLTEDMKWEEVTIFHTKKDKARGGCIHKINDEYTCVIEGSVKYFIGDEIIYLNTGDSWVIPKDTPHYFISLTDSTILEWGATIEEKKDKHILFREEVNSINEGEK